jgi:hypothetical protein
MNFEDIDLGPAPDPLAFALWERDTALDEVANLEFQIAQLEEKIRLLEQ